MMNKAFLIRAVEERLLALYSQGKLHGTIHTCVGQELVGIVVCEFLQPTDTVVSNHRCHGHYIAFTNDIKGLVAEIFGKATGVCGGRGGSQHLYHKGFYSYAIQGGMLPVAAGMALAKKIKNNNSITVVFIGDGTLGEGIVYEVLNIISKWNIPLLIVLENNYYAQSTHQSETLAGDIKTRIESFDIKVDSANTWEWEDFYCKAGKLINYVRRQSKPAVLTVDTYRLNGHSKGDDNREKSEIDYYKEIDPLNVYLTQNITAESDFNNQTQVLLTEVFNAANVDPFPSLSIPVSMPLNINYACNEYSQEFMSSELNKTFKDLMSKNSKILFIGEDVKSPYNGAFKISKDLSSLFPDQVFNTPISEAAIVGLGCGLALNGFWPIVEIMFGDFITLAFDQILNHISKFQYVYNEQVSIPLIIRTPMGGGRGYGATHSQTLDKHFMGIPGIKIIAINNLIHPRCVYQPLLTDNTMPVIVMENKILYTKKIRTSAPTGFQFEHIAEPYPIIVLSPVSNIADITIIGYGGLSDVLVEVINDLFIQHEILAQLICPIQIYPFEIQFIKEKLQSSKHIYVIEEGQGFAGFGAEIISQLVEKNGARTTQQLHRIYPPTMPIPASKPLEDLILPSKDLIINTILRGFV
ncbi:MAG: thiamine pyrophosphate-dependent enzyme [Pseudomonadota bacterium]